MTVQRKIVDVLFLKIFEFHYINFTGENERKNYLGGERGLMIIP